MSNKEELQVISGYKMVEGQYKIKGRVYEANDLIPKGSGFMGMGKNTSVDPKVIIECDSKKWNTKKKIKKQLNPIFNEEFRFDLQKKTKEQLEDLNIKFIVVDANALGNDTIIGTYEMDITSIYFSYQHEYYNVWLTLTDPTDEVEGIMGYLYIDICLMGPNDEMPVHDIQTAKQPGNNKDKALTPGKIQQQGHLINIEIYRGENMAPLDIATATVDAYVEVKYGGSSAKTKVVTSRNPEWNQKICLATMLPNQSKFITVTVYDKDALSHDDMIGSFKIKFQDIKEKDEVQIAPRWANLYGSTVDAQGDLADKMNLFGETLGSHYRGRILYKAYSYYQKDPKTEVKNLKFQFPLQPYPSVPQSSYVLRVDILEGHELPNRSQGYIHVIMGPYIVNTTKPADINDGRATWYESLPDKKVVFPEEVEDVPDVIFYFADDNREDRRHSYYRLNAKDLLCTTPEEYNQKFVGQVIKLKEDTSLDLVTDDEFPGFLYVRIALLKMAPPQREELSQAQIPNIDYQLRVYLYVARNIPPADDTGTSDPFVMIRCAGQTANSKIKQQTLSPGWFECMKLDVNLPDMAKQAIVPGGMFMMLYDADVKEDKKKEDQEPKGLKKYNPINLMEKLKVPSEKAEQTQELLKADELNEVDQEEIIIKDKSKRQLLGRVWIQFTNKLYQLKYNANGQQEIAEVVFRKPKWYNIIYDPTNEKCGEVLLSYALVPKDIVQYLPEEKQIYPRSRKEHLNIFCLGLRHVNASLIETGSALNKGYVTFDISGDEYDPIQSDVAKIKNEGISINKLIKLNIDLPNNKHFCPTIDICAWILKEGVGQKQLLGYGSFNLYEPLKRKFMTQQELLDNPLTESAGESELVSMLEKNALNNEEEESTKKKSVKPKIEFDVEREEYNIPSEIPEIVKKYNSDKYAKWMKEQIHKNMQSIHEQDNYQLLNQQNSLQTPKQINLPNYQQFQDDNKINLNYQPNQQTEINIIDINKQLSLQNQQLVQPINPENIILNDTFKQQQELVQIQHQSSIPIKVNSPNFDLLQNEKKQQLDIPNISTPKLHSTIQDQQTQQGNNQQGQSSLNPQGKQTTNQSILSKDQGQQQNNDPLIKKDSLQGEVPLIKKDPNNGKQPIIVQGVQKDTQDSQELFSHHEHEQLIDKRPFIQKEEKMNFPTQDGGLGVNQQTNLLTAQVISQLPEKRDIENKLLSNFQVKTNWTVDKATKISSKALSVNGIPGDNQKVATPKKQLIPRQEKKKLQLLGKIKNLFSFLSRKRQIRNEYYEDFDTDDGEDLDTVPPWRKNRDIEKDDLEDFMKPPKSVMKIPLLFGNSRSQMLKISDKGKPEPEISAYSKCLFIKEKEGQDIEKKTKKLQELLKPQDYVCRVYITKGISLPLISTQQCYLQMSLGGKTKNLKANSKRQGCSNPEFYIYEDLLCELPGSAFLTIQIMTDEGILGEDEVLGQTQVDLEDRFLTQKWQILNKDPKKFVPIEQRSLSKPGSGAIGRLELWIELIPKLQIKNRAPILIEPEPRYDMELRVIVHDARDCVFKDEVEQCNDLYVKGGPANQQLLETDIHWRCRQLGSFNWRWKFKQKFPLTIEEYGSDKFKVQLWDKDVVGQDDFIGECTIDLNTHNMINKCIKRKKPVLMKQRIIGKTMDITDRLWYHVYHPLKVDETGKQISQGQIRLSFELMPIADAKKFDNGNGRDAPNQYPILPEPTGRMKFDLIHPLNFLKDIIGPDLYRKIQTIFCIILCLAFIFIIGWVFVGQVIASEATK